MPPLTSMQLRRVFRHYLSSSLPPSQQFHRLLPLQSSISSHFPDFPRLPSLRAFASQSTAESKTLNPQESDQVAVSLSTELLKNPGTDPLSISQRLQLSFSHITPTPNIVLQTLNISSEAGRTVLGFNEWLVSNCNFAHSDETLSFFVDYFGRRKDFKATHEIMVGNKGIAGGKTLESAIDRLVRAGRPTQAVSFFEAMERDYGLKRDKESLKVVVEKLCENGYASYAEKMVKNLATEIFPDEKICDLLIKGWCVDGKMDEAKRLAAEMYRGGFSIGAMAYNEILNCVCKLCRAKDPFRLHSEVESILMDMEYHGVPRDVHTFNVLISNLCKIRKTEDALKLLNRMGEWNCCPDETTFLTLIRSLYQAARVAEGDEMIDRMKSSGYQNALDKKAYYGFLKILCGIERLDHAMSVLKKMKDDGCVPGIKTYDLLMGKWAARNRLDRANALYSEAVSSGLPLTPKEYKVDPGFMKKPTAAKKEKKRETLPEKMARKKRRLKQIRLSFVKKPTQKMRRSY